MKATTLYVVGAAPLDDPLDVIRPLRAHLLDVYSDVRLVGPGRDMSLRAMRRSFRPGVDRLMYDFTSLESVDWALSAIDTLPGAVLIAANNIVSPTGVLAGLRSAQRYAASGFRLPPYIAIGALDAQPPGMVMDRMMHRPVVCLTTDEPVFDVLIAVDPGAIEPAYAVLRAMGDSDRICAAMLAQTQRDMDDLMDMAPALGLGEAPVRLAVDRASVVASVASAKSFIGVSDRKRAGLTDGAFVAHSLGLSVLSVTSPAMVEASVPDFLDHIGGRDPAAADAFAADRQAKRFAVDLLSLIEEGARRVNRAAAA